jgi:hypothetical protein
LIFLALVFFVPMNVAAKNPSVHRLAESWSAMATAQLSKLGIKVTRLWMLDARSRYQQEIEELRESMNEIRLSRAHAGGTGVGWNDDNLSRRIAAAPPCGRSPRGNGSDFDAQHDAELRPANSFQEDRFGSDAGISLVENPVHKLT